MVIRVPNLRVRGGELINNGNCIYLIKSYVKIIDYPIYVFFRYFIVVMYIMETALLEQMKVKLQGVTECCDK